MSHKLVDLVSSFSSGVGGPTQMEQSLFGKNVEGLFSSRFLFTKPNNANFLVGFGLSQITTDCSITIVLPGRPTGECRLLSSREFDVAEVGDCIVLELAEQMD